MEQDKSLVPMTQIEQSVCIVEIGKGIGRDFIRTIGIDGLRMVMKRLTKEAEARNLSSKRMLEEAFFTSMSIAEEVPKMRPLQRLEENLAYSQIVSSIERHVPQRFWTVKYASVPTTTYACEPKNKHSGLATYHSFSRPSREVSMKYKTRRITEYFTVKVLDVSVSMQKWVEFERQRISEKSYRRMTEQEYSFWRAASVLEQIGRLIEILSKQKSAGAVSLDEYCDDWAKRLLDDVRKGRLKADGQSHKTEVTVYEQMLDKRIRKGLQ